MRYLTRGGIVFVTSLFFSIASIAQEVTVQVPQPTVTKVDIAIQNDSPIKLSVADNKNRNMPVLVFNVENTDTRAIRGYVIVSVSDNKKHVSTTTLVGDALKFGAVDKRGFSPFGSEKLSLMVDHVMFEDGTSWGADQYGRSRLIAAFIEGRDLAETRLKAMISDADHAVFLPQSNGLGSVTHGESADSLKPVRELHIRRNGYDNLLFRLRAMQTRNAEARELARKLEQMEYQ